MKPCFFQEITPLDPVSHFAVPADNTVKEVWQFFESTHHF